MRENAMLRLCYLLCTALFILHPVPSLSAGPALFPVPPSAPISFHGIPEDVSLSPEGRFAAVSFESASGGGVVLWDVRGNRLIGIRDFEGSAVDFAVPSPDGRHFLAARHCTAATPSETQSACHGVTRRISYVDAWSRTESPLIDDFSKFENAGGGTAHAFNLFAIGFDARGANRVLIAGSGVQKDRSGPAGDWPVNFVQLFALPLYPGGEDPKLLASQELPGAKLGFPGFDAEGTMLMRYEPEEVCCDPVPAWLKKPGLLQITSSGDIELGDTPREPMLTLGGPVQQMHGTEAPRGFSLPPVNGEAAGTPLTPDSWRTIKPVQWAFSSDGLTAAIRGFDERGETSGPTIRFESVRERKDIPTYMMIGASMGRGHVMSWHLGTSDQLVQRMGNIVDGYVFDLAAVADFLQISVEAPTGQKGTSAISKPDGPRIGTYDPAGQRRNAADTGVITGKTFEFDVNNGPCISAEDIRRLLPKAVNRPVPPGGQPHGQTFRYIGVSGGEVAVGFGAGYCAESLSMILPRGKS